MKKIVRIYVVAFIILCALNAIVLLINKMDYNPDFDSSPYITYAKFINRKCELEKTAFYEDNKENFEKTL